MASLETIVFKTLPASQESQPLCIDIYRPSNHPPPTNDTVILFFHAGGWTFVSADYRLLPQASGQEIWEDVRDAYSYVANRLHQNLDDDQESIDVTTKRKRKIILAGASAGGYLPFLALSHLPQLQPPPVALLIYYGIPSFSHPTFNTSHVFGKPIERQEIASILNDPKIVISTADGPTEFSIDCLDSNLSRNSAYQSQPEKDPRKEYGRPDIYDWLVQENLYPKIFQNTEGNFDLREVEDDEAPKLVMLHCVDDLDVPFACTKDYANACGKDMVRLVEIRGTGGEHMFDKGLFLEDRGEVVDRIQEAWGVLDSVVESGGF